MSMYSYPAGSIINGVLTEDRTVRPALPFIINNVAYPVTVFSLWTPAELAAIGIKEFQEEMVPLNYESGSPVDVETAYMIKRTYPNKVANLEAMREAKRQQIQNEKVRIRDGGITVDGILFDTDASAMSAYTRTMVFIFSVNPSAIISNWKASEGVWVEMNMALMQRLITEGDANEKAAFTWQKQQEAKLVDAKTVEAIEAVSVTYG